MKKNSENLAQKLQTQDPSDMPLELDDENLQHISGGFDMPWDYGAYAACFYGGWAGGGDVNDVANSCQSEWLGK